MHTPINAGFCLSIVYSCIVRFFDIDGIADFHTVYIFFINLVTSLISDFAFPLIPYCSEKSIQAPNKQYDYLCIFIYSI